MSGATNAINSVPKEGAPPPSASPPAVSGQESSVAAVTNQVTPAAQASVAPTTPTSVAPTTPTSATPATPTTGAPATQTAAAPATQTPAAPATQTPAAPATQTPAAPATPPAAAPATPTTAAPATPPTAVTATPPTAVTATPPAAAPATPTSTAAPAAQPTASPDVQSTVVPSTKPPATNQVAPDTEPSADNQVAPVAQSPATTEVQTNPTPSAVANDGEPLVAESKDNVSASNVVNQITIENNGSDKSTADTKQGGNSAAITELAKTAPFSPISQISNEQSDKLQDENQPKNDNKNEEKKGGPESGNDMKTPEGGVQGGESPALANTQSQPNNEPVENGEAGEETDQCVNIDELTEHVMNIINEGMAQENSSQDELQKKNMELQQFIVKLIHLLKEKTDLSINLERQNSALISQAKSLKDVIAITKDLLGIRNMEIEHLHADLDSMQENIKQERTRHNTAVQHLNEAMGLNDKLKAEYLTQMDLFEKLKEKYTEKVVLLTRENIRLNALAQQHGIDTSVPSPGSSDSSNQSESVDK